MFTFDLPSQLFVATLFGGMVFFPSIVAPVVFRALDQASARDFLRTLFPRYYAFIIALSALSTITLACGLRWAEAAWLAGVALSTLWVRQSLMPRINAARDASLAGDADAKKTFDRGHKLSVRINMVQMVGVLVVLGLL